MRESIELDGREHVIWLAQLAVEKHLDLALLGRSSKAESDNGYL